MKYHLLPVAVFIVSCSVLYGQVKQTRSGQQVWAGFFSQARLSNHWGVWLDAHGRTRENFFHDFSQAITRVGITRYISEDLKITAGYAWVNHFPSDNHRNISQPEHRSWQQVQWHSRYPGLRLMQWFRTEQRWRRKILNDEELASGYLFNHRFRYNFFSQFPLGKKRFRPGSLYLVLNDEVHINAGKEIIHNYFDQNRFFLGVQFQPGMHDNLQIGYMNLFRQLEAGNQYRSIHVARIFYFYNLDLRKPQSN